MHALSSFSDLVVINTVNDHRLTIFIVRIKRIAVNMHLHFDTEDECHSSLSILIITLLCIITKYFGNTHVLR